MEIDPKAVRTELATHANPERAVHEKGYLKSDLEFIGVSVPAIRKVARRLARSLDDGDRGELLVAVRALWNQPVHELRSVAAMMLEALPGSLEAEDLPLVESMLREAGTWAHVDLLAVHVVGPLVSANPELASELDRWSTDEDFWIRRSAMLALLVRLREGGGDWERFAGYAEAMWDESEFFIRKAIGWVLRDASKRSPERVVQFLRPRAHRASGVTIREAVKYLPEAEREVILAAYRSKTPTA